MTAAENAAPRAKRSSHWLDWKLYVGIAITLGLLYYAAPKDPAEIDAAIKAFKSADYIHLPAFYLILAVFYWLKAYRWGLLLKPIQQFSTAQLVPPVMVGFAFNNVLPAHLGEFVRVFVFSRQTKIAKTSVLATVALERLFDVVAIISLLGAGLVLVEDLDESLKKAGLMFAGASAVAIVGAGIYVFFTDAVLAFVRWCFRVLPLPESFEEKVLALAELGAEGLHSIRSMTLLTGILVISFVKWLLNGFLVWLTLYAFGLDVSAPMTFVLLGAVALAVTIPSSPGYFGVIQGTFWLVLQTLPHLADRQADVFAASIFYHLAQWIPVTLYGMWCFKQTGLHMADVEHAAEEMPEEIVEEIHERETVE